MKKNSIAQNEGMALLIATLFVMAAIATVGTLTLRSMGQKNDVDHFIEYDRAFSGLEAAVTIGMNRITGGSNGFVGVPVGTGGRGRNFLVPSIDSFGSTTLPTVPGMPDVEYFAIDQNWQTDGLDNNGDGTIDDSRETGWHTLHVRARCGSTVRGAEVVVRGNNVNVWTNAIFAGEGSAAGTIHGNVGVHGSIHLLGDNIPGGGDTVNVLDLSGTSFIHNYYDKTGGGQAIDARLLASVPAQPLVTVGGEANQKSLSAKVRTRKGLINTSGNASIGEPNSAGNGLKDLVDACYTNNGFVGTLNVHSDNGRLAKYDLGNSATMPKLTDPWRWPGNTSCEDLVGTGHAVPPAPGDMEFKSDGTPMTTLEYFDKLANNRSYTGNVTFGGTNAASNFYWNGNTGVQATGTAAVALAAARVKRDSATCTPGDDYIYYNASNKVLEVNGQVQVTGAVSFTGTVYQTGRASLLVKGAGTVSVEGDVYTCNNGDPNNYTESFPVNNVLGIMATDSATIGGTSQIRALGAFYATNMISSNKQTSVMGTYVSKEFSLLKNVPDIYQVPNLAENLPFGMLAANPRWVMSRVYWREVPVS